MAGLRGKKTGVRWTMFVVGRMHVKEAGCSGGGEGVFFCAVHHDQVTAGDAIQPSHAGTSTDGGRPPKTTSIRWAYGFGVDANSHLQSERLDSSARQGLLGMLTTSGICGDFARRRLRRAFCTADAADVCPLGRSARCVSGHGSEVRTGSLFNIATTLDFITFLVLQLTERQYSQQPCCKVASCVGMLTAYAAQYVVERATLIWLEDRRREKTPRGRTNRHTAMKLSV
ncbi:hypothetical protein BC628DRAFT_49922 [Trametes gibbosa]|nr:hypothetical protein BC628DRAFT_49922 [Trametes gibbosa]